MAAGYVSGTHSMAFVTVPNEELGKKLARGLLEKKLVACVNIIPGVKSLYEWEGKIEEDQELLLMIKTRTSLVAQVAAYVKENHSYDVAEVISSPIDQGNTPYLEWISKVVPDSPSSA
jgi:periplasmic divalent cation tolerance protein